MAEIKCESCNVQMVTSPKWKCYTSTLDRDYTYAIFAQRERGLLIPRNDNEPLVPEIYVCPECGRVTPVLKPDDVKRFLAVAKDGSGYKV